MNFLKGTFKVIYVYVRKLFSIVYFNLFQHFMWVPAGGKNDVSESVCDSGVPNSLKYVEHAVHYST